MAYAFYIKEIGRGKEGARDLTAPEAYHLFAALLDGGVPELELGAILMTLRMKGEAASEILGFQRAVEERTQRLDFASAVRPVVIPTYNGAKHAPNLLPLVALLLTRLGIPVLIHGALHGEGRVATVYVLRELGILPSVTLAQAEAQLESDGLAFLPTQALVPGLASLLALRGRLGVRNVAHTLAKLVMPFSGDSALMLSATHPYYLNLIREYLLTTGHRGLLMRATEGEAFADPKRRPRIDYFVDARREVLFEEEVAPLSVLPNLPQGIDAAASAAWIRRALAGEVPVPLPILHQLACCLYASGYSADMHQAKAVVAVATRGLSAA
ncbi:MAG TPA: DNA-binding protein YbiB [Burkholderiales bacterium]|nr:DNA-binding protein YbiB [Burkholderiales bacterium]